MSVLVAKVLMLGDSNVGKTSLLKRIVDDKFDGATQATHGIDFRKKEVVVTEDLTLKLMVFDTAGQERYMTISPAYYRGAAGIVVMYSIDKRESFDHVERWMEQIGLNAERSVQRILVAGKLDIEEKRQVSSEEGAALAAKYAIPFFEVSSLTAQNVDKAFQALVDSIVIAKVDNPSIVEDIPPTPQPTQSGCCLSKHPRIDQSQSASASLRVRPASAFA
jgi:small GTP-binding protein